MANVDIVTSAERMRPLVVGETIFRSSNDFQLTEKDLEIAYQELKESKNERDKCLRLLKEILAEDTDVTYNHTDDKFLLRFLRLTKFDCGRAFKMVQTCQTVRNKHPELISLPSNLKTLLNYNIATYLPYTDENGCVVFCIKIKNLKLEDVSINEFLQMVFAFLDIITMNPHCQINGTVVLFDMRGMTARHISLFLFPKTLRLLSDMLQICYPTRPKCIIVIHSSSLMQSVYRVIRPFLKKKIADRVKFMGFDTSELHQLVTPAILPKEYGGNLDESECSITQHILDNLPYLEHMRSFSCS